MLSGLATTTNTFCHSALGQGSLPEGCGAHNPSYCVTADSGELTEEAAVRTWTGDATEVKITCTGTDSSHRAYIQAIKVTYE